MDNDLIKALRCIASQGEDGNCKMDWHNLLRKDDEPKMYCSNKIWGDEAIQCPYHQDKYGVCFEDGDCREWLNEVADILENQNKKNEELKHLLEAEMELSNAHMGPFYNPMFNGVEVGHDKQVELNKAHVRFCEQILKMIGSD